MASGEIKHRSTVLRARPRSRAIPRAEWPRPCISSISFTSPPLGNPCRHLRQVSGDDAPAIEVAQFKPVINNPLTSAHHAAPPRSCKTLPRCDLFKIRQTDNFFKTSIGHQLFPKPARWTTCFTTPPRCPLFQTIRTVSDVSQICTARQTFQQSCRSPLFLRRDPIAHFAQNCIGR